MFAIACFIAMYVVIFYGEFALRRYRDGQAEFSHAVSAMILAFVVGVVALVNLYFTTVKWEIAVLGTVTYVSGSLLIALYKSAIFFRDNWRGLMTKTPPSA